MWRFDILREDILIILLKPCQGEGLALNIPHAVGSGQFLGIIRHHVGGIFACFIIVVHDQRIQGGIEDLHSGFAVFDGFLDLETCHAAQQVWRILLCAGKVAKRVIKEHLIALVIGEGSVGLENLGIAAENYVNALLQEEGDHCF